MTYAEEIRRQAETAPRAALPAVTAALWRAYGEGRITDAEAEVLSVLIESRRSSGTGPGPGQSPNSTGTGRGEETAEPRTLVQAARRAVGSRPRTDASMERRRRWAASGRLPPGLAARFTLAEQAVLALVAAETTRRKDCRLSIENMAAVAGVCRSTVKNAIREARRLGLLTVEERPITGFRNDTNVLRIVSAEWLAWIRLARRGDPLPNGGGRAASSSPRGGGVKSVTSTPTEVLTLLESGKAEASKGCRQAASDLERSARAGIRTGGGSDRAMR
ncbi:helix-turn-helix domain-containing protein [Methylobacterium radiotolerans]|uniref:helix-turn-helix domain-containing protein n=1 Tax=Methylobacterium radiotolerans TaxID=31998 RepID=UPI000977E321|nr:helix-turn-helix domain-containing protein [Methylobacterium radiotolerans]